MGIAPAAPAAAPAAASVKVVPTAFGGECSTFQWIIAPHPCFVFTVLM
ncbi:hypothetical protein JAV76_13010 [Sanguibacter sp. YZGR15]|uniref:Uncharacterized protein n=1 Tax=Sanguibacter suaedae TaxID=2795737 RepID=A0A934MAM5_9MICO|nr:hypothetical protein [Sanguibacter suaedae]